MIKVVMLLLGIAISFHNMDGIFKIEEASLEENMISIEILENEYANSINYYIGYRDDRAIDYNKPVFRIIAKSKRNDSDLDVIINQTEIISEAVFFSVSYVNETEQEFIGGEIYRLDIEDYDNVEPAEKVYDINNQQYDFMPLFEIDENGDIYIKKHVNI